MGASHNDGADWYFTHPDIGAGLPVWTDSGTTLRATIAEFWSRIHRSHGYEIVTTPHVVRPGLWKAGGHIEHFSDNIFFAVAGKRKSSFVVKPTNCPLHCLVFQHRTASYRDLPVRIAELSTVYRYEPRGSLSGLSRTRSITQDDAHIFCLLEQVAEEIAAVVRLTRSFFDQLGFGTLRFYLGTSHSKTESSDMWQATLDAALKGLQIANEQFSEVPNGGAFYGPQLDVAVVDDDGTEWLLPNVQIDGMLARRLGLKCAGRDGAGFYPVIIHRTILGSLERLVSMMARSRHRLPFWLEPTQVRVLPLSAESAVYGKEVLQLLTRMNLRADVRCWPERLSSRVARAHEDRIPVIAVLGDREARAATVSYRGRFGNGSDVPRARFVEFVASLGTSDCVASR